MSKKILVSVIVFIILCICIWFQINFLNYFKLFGVAANLGLVFIVGIGLLSGKFPGGLAGATYGLMLDFLFGKSIGVYFSIYMLTGTLAGAISKDFSKENKLSIVYMVALFSVIAEFITYIVCVVIYGYQFELFDMCIILIKETIYNMILARMLFKPLTFLAEIINKSQNSYYLL